MPKKALKMTFYNADGEKVELLSKDVASVEDVVSALHFLTDQTTIELSIVEIEVGNQTSGF